MDMETAEPSNMVDDDQRIREVVLWLTSVVAAGIAGFALIELRYVEPFDCSNHGLHESASTQFGWTVALVASLVPVLVAHVLVRRRAPIHYLAVGVAVISLVVWTWLLNPGGC